MYTYIRTEGSRETNSPFKWLSQSDAFVDMLSDAQTEAKKKKLSIVKQEAVSGIVTLSNGTEYRLELVNGTF